MKDASIIAVVAVGMLPIIGSIIAIASPIVKLNSTINVLANKIDTLVEDKHELSSRLKIVEDTVNILSRNQEIYYNDVARLAERLEDCESSSHSKR